MIEATQANHRGRNNLQKRQPLQNSMKGKSPKKRNQSRKPKNTVCTPVSELKPWQRVNLKVYVLAVSDPVEKTRNVQNCEKNSFLIRNESPQPKNPNIVTV